jgi:hypothetical protein
MRIDNRPWNVFKNTKFAVRSVAEDVHAFDSGRGCPYI